MLSAAHIRARSSSKLSSPAGESLLATKSSHAEFPPHDVPLARRWTHRALTNYLRLSRAKHMPGKQHALALLSADCHTRWQPKAAVQQSARPAQPVSPTS